MPSRRNQRQPSDAIEEGSQSQHTREDDVDEEEDLDAMEEDAPRRSSKKVTAKGKIAKSTRRKRESSRRDDADSDNEDGVSQEVVSVSAPIDIENFENQPLLKTDLARIGGMSNDWDNVIGKMKETVFPIMNDVSAGVAEASLGSDGEPALKELAKLDIVMRELLDTRAELNAHKDALDAIQHAVAVGDNITDIVERYNEDVTARVEKWRGMTSRQKYGKDAEYIKMKQLVFEVLHDEAMPPVIEMIPKEDGDDDDDDDDVVVGGSTQQVNCPLTLTILVNPMTSTVCGHSFSATSIKEYLGGNRSAKKKCPATGCNKMFGTSDLQEDKALEKKVKAWERRERRKAAEAGSDDDAASEVIE
ncbi:hypothetical protein BD410DRAFT_858350 [Rickenella mellea]|uniref:SP-RING-type domain-containing protein n=1 Tax=Rickenella mellea TaxID=50990 RepID=A0A4Y7Q786_9AGAM|nr:hypothetical protein BD410DRAFT_858350 [Rickenella mellea]